MRDYLVNLWKHLPEVLLLAQGFCSIHEALQMHDYIYEGIILNIAKPDKIKEEILDFINQAKSLKTNFKYHGNYCGPGWSDGKYQNSVEGKSKPVDKLDQLCKEHDESYARGEDLLQADIKLAYRALLLDPKLSVGIAGQALLRKLGIMVRHGKRKGGQRLKPKEKAQVRRIAAKASGRTKRRRNGGFRRRRSGVPNRSQPLRRGGNIRGRVTRNNSTTNAVVVGEDFIGSVTTSSTVTVGTVTNAFALSAESWSGTRLQQYFNMYERWEIENMSFWYEPVVATTEPGSLVMFVDPDPNDGMTVTSTNAVQKAMSAQGSKMFQVSAPTGIKFKPEKLTGNRYTSDDGVDTRLSSFGTLFYFTCFRTYC